MDEALVPKYTLPDPLRFEDGSPVVSAADWTRRRAELLGIFASQVHGKNPVGKPDEMRFEPRKRVEGFLDGRATLEEIRIHFSAKDDGPHLDLLVIKPASIPEGGVPVFLTLNFNGNHSIHPSPEISLSSSWMRPNQEDEKAGHIVNNRATEASRGAKAAGWPVEMIIDAGVALATFYYGDVDPDVDDGFKNGIHALFGKPADLSERIA